MAVVVNRREDHLVGERVAPEGPSIARSRVTVAPAGSAASAQDRVRAPEDS